MGVFETYCAFCSGPLGNAYEAWHDDLRGNNSTYPPKDGEWYNPPGYPVPTKEKGEIIRITLEDGKYWKDWVCIGPMWPDYVSPSCTDDPYGGIYIDGQDVTDQIGRTSRFHRGCLSLFCRFTGSTPQSLYESLYDEDSDYRRFGEDGRGLMYCITYFDMGGRAEQSFKYAIEKEIPREEYEKTRSSRWFDPETMEECNWLLARPTVFPAVPTTELVSTADGNEIRRTLSVSSELPISAIRKVFNIPELLDIILSALIEPLPKTAFRNEKFMSPTPSTLATTTRVVLGLLSINRHFRSHILTSRQDLFLSLAWQHAWMLPCTPLDGRSWTEVNPSIPLSDLCPALDSRTSFHYQPANHDWRSYLLTFLRKEEPHVRNRWRMYRMAMQFAVGKKMPARTDFKEWAWHCGDCAHIPVPFEEGVEQDWEVPPSPRASDNK